MSDWMVSRGFHHYKPVAEFAAVTGKRGEWAWQVGSQSDAVTGTETTLAAAKARVAAIVVERRAARKAEA